METYPPNIAEVNVSYSRNIKPEDMPQIKSSAESAELLRNIWNGQIEFYYELMNELINEKED